MASTILNYCFGNYLLNSIEFINLKVQKIPSDIYYLTLEKWSQEYLHDINLVKLVFSLMNLCPHAFFLMTVIIILYFALELCDKCYLFR